MEARISVRPAEQITSSKLFLETLRRVMREHNYLPAAQSPAEIEIAQQLYSERQWQGSLHEQSDSQGQMALLASIQHFSVAIEDYGRRPAAFIVLIRAALEAAGSAHFLTAQSIETSAERARRGLNEMLFGAFQQWQALDQYGQSSDAAGKLATINQWLTLASAYPELGPITRAHEARRRPAAPHAGPRRPTITALLDDLFPTEDEKRFGRWLYAAVSAPAHSSPHGYAIAGAQTLLPDGTQRIKQDARLPIDRVGRYAISGLSAVSTAAKSVFARYGWRYLSAEDALRAAYEAWLAVLSD
jgi:hypothetical protein